MLFFFIQYLVIVKGGTHNHMAPHPHPGKIFLWLQPSCKSLYNNELYDWSNTEKFTVPMVQCNIFNLIYNYIFENLFEFMLNFMSDKIAVDKKELLSISKRFKPSRRLILLLTFGTMLHLL